jgi:hypothetical protein
MALFNIAEVVSDPASIIAPLSLADILSIGGVGSHEHSNNTKKTGVKEYKKIKDDWGYQI